MTRLAPLRSKLEASRALLLAELERFGEADFGRRPAPGAWSAGHVTEHLARVDHGMTRGIGAALAGKLAIEPRWSDPLTRLLYHSGLYTVIRVRTSPAMDPAEAAPRAEALAKLASTRTALLAALDGADPAELLRHRLRHPIFGPLPMAHMLRFVAYHEVRHAKQLGRIRAALGGARG